MWSQRAVTLAIVLGSSTLLCRSQNDQTRTIVFVCEHGSAKSVIAAAHFNRIAESKRIPYPAISRGIHPDAEIPRNIKDGLLADSLDVSGWTPTMIGDSDIRRADRVITLACELPKSKSAAASKLIDWNNIPAVSDGYAEARAAIVQNIEQLLQTLSAKKPLAPTKR